LSNCPIKNKRNNDSYSSKYKYLFEDVETKSRYNQYNSFARSTYKFNTQQFLLDECDLSNLNKYCNNSEINKTINENNISKSETDFIDKGFFNSSIKDIKKNQIKRRNFK